MPVPTSKDPHRNGSKNGAVTIADVLAVVSYIGTVQGGGQNANRVSYDSTKDGDWFNVAAGTFGTDGNTGTDDAVGRQYDRTPSRTSGEPWRSGPPNGAVSIQDALVALDQVGDACG